MFRYLLFLAFLLHGSFGYLLSHGGHFSHQQTGPEKCIECKSDFGRYYCDREEHCHDGEVCFRQEYSKDGQTFYHAGCIDTRHCDSMTTSSYHWEFSHEHLKDGACCSTTNCNTQSLLKTNHLTTTTLSITSESHAQTASPVKQCLKCHDEGMVGWQCDKVDTCTANQACFVQQLEFETYLPGISPTYFHGGCIDTSECSKVQSRSVNDEHGLAKLLRGECCFTTDCNRGIKATYEALFKLTTSPKPVTTTIKEPTTTTTVPKTTAAVTTTAATDATTTTTPGTTSTSTSQSSTTAYPTTTNIPIKGLTSTSSNVQNGNMCLVCSDENCKSYIPYQCPESYPLCLTSVNNEDGNAIYDKRCASFSECAERWLIESSLKPECTSLSQNTTFGPGLDCTFCCDADSCNKDTVPPAETLVYKF